MRTGTAASAASNNRILLLGEEGYTTDTHVFKVGDGVTHWNDLAAVSGATLTEEQVEDYVGGMVTGNTETGIDVTYQDTDGTIDFVVPDATGSVNGLVRLAGDLGGTAAAPTVTGLSAKAADSAAVHNTGAETVAGVKTFASSPSVPDSSFTIAKTTGLQTALDAKQASGTYATTSDVTTASTSDRARANHTGSQAASTISDFDEAAQDAVGGMWTGNTETRIAVTYDDSGAKLNAVVEPFPVAIPFNLSGAIVTGVGTKRIYNPMGRTVTVKKITIHLVTAPTGAAFVVDANINGTTMYTTQGNRPSIAASANVSTAGSTDSAASGWDDGEYITVDIDQVGSTIAGSDLTGMIYGEI